MGSLVGEVPTVAGQQLRKQSRWRSQDDEPRAAGRSCPRTWTHQETDLTQETPVCISSHIRQAGLLGRKVGQPRPCPGEAQTRLGARWQQVGLPPMLAGVRLTASRAVPEVRTSGK